MRIATLRKDLERVLFSPGIHHLRDPRCGVRNFGKSLDEIPLAEEFDFMRTPQYIPPSKDQVSYPYPSFLDIDDGESIAARGNGMTIAGLQASRRYVNTNREVAFSSVGANEYIGTS